ncbi:MAG: CDP-diacylglycerol--glycerol-3-phosphate 3-phosphatidyltransferase [Chlamydiae bacterium CG10_big_fil_rev_8_21_14_0_10_35_9]|nr:MAG: CDP-diacylglycerol--glycerol-3-phosphate 3-phosphatidyltransferase [Chlamydiae bacterium CG10_big_fil_rev_8_21_14_0_10_35_9]
MSVAHYFTILRILLIPFFSIFYLYPQVMGISTEYLPIVLMIILGICEFSDLFDGFVARKKNQVTDLGKVMDPMADSITRITVFFTFTQGIVKLPLLLVLVFIYREFIVNTLRTLCALKGFALAARRSGKIKAVLQAASMFFILTLMVLFNSHVIGIDDLQHLSFIAVAIVAGYTVLSAVDYFYANRNYIKKALAKN